MVCSCDAHGELLQVRRAEAGGTGEGRRAGDAESWADPRGGVGGVGADHPSISYSQKGTQILCLSGGLMKEVGW